MKKSIRYILNQPYLGISLLLLVFLLKGFLFVTILPIFQGPDEPIHYATIQYFNEPKEKNWNISQMDKKDYHPDGDNTDTYHYSEEIKKAASLSKFDEIKFNSFNISSFSPTFENSLEQTLSQSSWKKYIDNYPASVVGGPSFYYRATSQIEKLFSSSDILVRFFVIRLFSVFLGVMIIFLTYLTFLKVGLDKRQSLIISTIVAFQPMFTQTAAIINYDIPLLLAFSIFTYAGISLLKSGFNRKYILLLFLGALIGATVKGPGLLLIALMFPILTYLSYIKFTNKKKFFIYLIIFLVAIPTLFIIFGPKDITNIFTNFSNTSTFSTPLEAIKKYTSIAIGRWKFFELTYWGSFGWLDARVSETILSFVWLTEIIALAGLIYAFLFKKKLPPFLPLKKYIIFSILMLLALQFTIRFYDWKLLYDTNSMVGTPGRYFLPNIASHFLVLFFGLGSFCPKKKYFDTLLIISMILMITFFCYSLFNIVIPRYYL